MSYVSNRRRSRRQFSRARRRRRSGSVLSWNPQPSSISSEMTTVPIDYTCLPPATFDGRSPGAAGSLPLPSALPSTTSPTARDRFSSDRIETVPATAIEPQPPGVERLRDRDRLSFNWRALSRITLGSPSEGYYTILPIRRRERSVSVAGTISNCSPNMPNEMDSQMDNTVVTIPT